MSRLLFLRPRLSEKAYGLSESRNTYVFDVSSDFNRQEVTKAVGDQYSVKVERVRLANSAAKPTRKYQRRGRVVHKSQVASIRKAYVTLAEGETLPIFAAVEESATKGSK